MSLFVWIFLGVRRRLSNTARSVLSQVLGCIFTHLWEETYFFVLLGSHEQLRVRYTCVANVSILNNPFK
jgi:hypothetical protein